MVNPFVCFSTAVEVGATPFGLRAFQKRFMHTRKLTPKAIKMIQQSLVNISQVHIAGLQAAAAAAARGIIY
jgi:hypothetical protein